jgi:DNA-binding TFAR19-related protein (PDSD5 family)
MFRPQLKIGILDPHRQMYNLKNENEDTTKKKRKKKDELLTVILEPSVKNLIWTVRFNRP